MIYKLTHTKMMNDKYHFSTYTLIEHSLPNRMFSLLMASMYLLILIKQCFKHYHGKGLFIQR